MVKQFDVNADGKITREESAGAQWFNRVDSNADGVIDAEELAMVKKIVSRGLVLIGGGHLDEGIKIMTTALDHFPIGNGGQDGALEAKPSALILSGF
jgi:Ca2+-binding EF-hand superfamily protein